MNKQFILVTLAAGVLLAGCATTLKPTYNTTDPDAMQIGNEKPADQAPEVMNMGSFCQEVSSEWKADGKTPDGQTVWSKEVHRKVVACP